MDLNTLLNQAGDKIIEANQLLGDLSLATGVEATDNNDGGSDAIQEVLEAGNGSKKSQNLKKLLAAAAIAKELAQGKGANVDPESVAANVDAGTSKVHAAYDTQTGRKSADQAIEELLDRGAVYAVQISEKAIDTIAEKAHAVADIVVEKGLDKVVDVTINAIATKFPTVRKAAPYVKAVVNMAKPVIKKVVHTGIDILANVAKKAMKVAVGKAKTLAVKIGKKLSNALFA